MDIPTNKPDPRNMKITDMFKKKPEPVKTPKTEMTSDSQTGRNIRAETVNMSQAEQNLAPDNTTCSENTNFSPYPTNPDLEQEKVKSKVSLSNLVGPETKRPNRI